MNGPTNIVLMDEKGNTADIAIYDVRDKNGIIHVVDRVLEPSGAGAPGGVQLSYCAYFASNRPAPAASCCAHRTARRHRCRLTSLPSGVAISSGGHALQPLGEAEAGRDLQIAVEAADIHRHPLHNAPPRISCIPRQLARNWPARCNPRTSCRPGRSAPACGTSCARAKAAATAASALACFVIGLHQHHGQLLPWWRWAIWARARPSAGAASKQQRRRAAFFMPPAPAARALPAGLRHGDRGRGKRDRLRRNRGCRRLE